MSNKQYQEAGDNSQQVQAGMVVINGIDEKRAREIIDEKFHELSTKYSDEASVLAEERIRRFANDFIPKLVKNDLMDALKDPSIQMLLLEAEKSAASSERLSDYGMLSELLIHRSKNNLNRNIRASVSRAVEIVDEISDEALLGITVAYSVSQWVPTSGNIIKGLETLDSLFGKILYDSLPDGKEWIEHLEILDCVRINVIGSLKTLDKIYIPKLSGYVDAGIDKTSENFFEAIKLLEESGLPKAMLVEHELRPGFVRLNLTRRDDVGSLFFIKKEPKYLNGEETVQAINVPLNENQKMAVEKIFSLYDNDEKLLNQNIDVFMEKWNNFGNLKRLRTWWDAIPISFEITPVGRVLAHANAQRCDSTLPALD